MEDSKKGEKFEKPRTLLSWVAPSRLFIQRQRRWFFGLVVLIGVLVAFLLIVNEWSLALFFGAFGFIVFVLSMVEPDETEYEITNLGLKISGKLFSWEDLNSFCISLAEGEAFLILKTKLMFPDHIEILLGDQSQSEIEEKILEYLPYEEIRRSSFLAFLDGLITGVSRRIPEVKRETASQVVTNQEDKKVESAEKTDKKSPKPSNKK